MPGATSTMTYNNATLDNWIMALGYGRGARWCSISVNSETSEATTTRHSGGISAYVQRTATGIYSVTWEEAFKNTPMVFATTWEGTNYNYQVHVYDVSTVGCKVMTMVFAVGAWSLSNSPDWSLHAIGR